jgi:serine/threonine-protein kinase
MIFGTPEYMSPEQAGGKHADLRADVYAVGIILYEMFTGAVPFTGETFLGVLAKHLNETAPPMSAVFPELGISPELEAVILRALEKDPAARYQSMSDLSQALQATPEGRGVFRGAAALSSSATEFHDYQAVPPGAFTAPQFRDQGGASAQGAESHAPTIAQVGPVPTPSLASASVPAGTEPGPQTTPHATGAPAREGTHAATTTTVEPSKGRTGVLVLVALALAGAAGAAFVLKRGEPTGEHAAATATAETPPAPAKAETPTPAPTPVTIPAPTPTVSVAVATQVRLSVVTEPPGATLTKDGFQVCDKTPCEVMAAPNETLELEATKDTLSGKAKVLAQRDQSVSIKLAGAVKKATSKPRLCEVEVDGIKILRPCQ